MEVILLSRIALYYGSFNPITLAHTEIMEAIKEQYDIDTVVIECSNNKFYSKKDLIANEYREDMISNRLDYLDDYYLGGVASSSDSHCKFYDLAKLYSENGNDIFIIIGEDNLKTFEKYYDDKSEHIKDLLDNFKIIVVTRGSDITDTESYILNNEKLKVHKDNFLILEYSSNISSSEVRDRIRKGLSVKNMIDYTTLEYIEENGLYKEDFNNLYINLSTRTNLSTMDMINSEKKLGDVTLNMPSFMECHNCNSCLGRNCKLKDNDELIKVVDSMLNYKNIHFCLPVYLNMPTAKTLSLLSRLSMLSETAYSRKLFNDQNAYLHIISDVSGTQSVGNMMLGALNMIGFNLRSRCVRSYVKNWKDLKIRGGEIDIVKYMPNNNFNTYSATNGDE